MQLEVYLDVIVVLARQLGGQFTFGLGTSIPQPTHFGGELQMLDRDRRSMVEGAKDVLSRGRWEAGGGGKESGGEEIEMGYGGKVIKAKQAT